MIYRYRGGACASITSKLRSLWRASEMSASSTCQLLNNNPCHSLCLQDFLLALKALHFGRRGLDSLKDVANDSMTSKTLQAPEVAAQAAAPDHGPRTGLSQHTVTCSGSVLQLRGLQRLLQLHDLYGN